MEQFMWILELCLKKEVHINVLGGGGGDLNPGVTSSQEVDEAKVTWGDKGREGDRKIGIFGWRHLWMTPKLFLLVNFLYRYGHETLQEEFYDDEIYGIPTETSNQIYISESPIIKTSVI